MTPSPSSAEHVADHDLVTVVIPARDEEGFIGPCLDSVLAQDHRNLQVVVVDGASGDRTADIVKAYAESDPRVELIINPERIIPVSLNLALAAARGAWMVRVDAHSTVPPTYVRGAVAHLASGRWGGVGGRKIGVGHTPAGRAIARSMSSRFGVGDSIYHYGTEQQSVDHVPFGAYPVALARQLGGWDEELTANEDYEFDHRIRGSGHDLLFDPDLTIDWHCRQSVGDLYRQYMRYGRGKAAVARKHPASLQPRHLAAPALVATIAAAAVLGPRRPAWALALLAPYVTALTVATTVTAAELDGPARRWVAPAFLAMHVGWGLGFWQGIGRIGVAVARRDGRTGG